MFSGLKRWFDSLKTHKMPPGSYFFDKLVPALLILLGIITLIGILYAVALGAGLVSLS